MGWQITASGDVVLNRIVLIAAAGIVGFWFTGYVLDRYEAHHPIASAAAAPITATPLACDAAISADGARIGVMIRMPQ